MPLALRSEVYALYVQTYWNDVDKEESHHCTVNLNNYLDSNLSQG